MANAPAIFAGPSTSSSTTSGNRSAERESLELQSAKTAADLL